MDRPAKLRELLDAFRAERDRLDEERARLDWEIETIEALLDDVRGARGGYAADSRRRITTAELVDEVRAGLEDIGRMMRAGRGNKGPILFDDERGT